MVKGLWPPCHQASVPMIWRQNHLWHVVGLWISQNSSAEFVWNKPPGRSFRTRQPAMPNAPTPSWGLSSNALEDLVTGLMDYTLELWSVCSLVENEHVVIWKIPSTFWKRRVREILQTEMQWPRTPVLVATTAQKCKETVHKEPVVLQKKSFLSQHSQVAGVSVSTAPYFATVCVFFFMVLGSWLMMSCQVTQNLKIHDNFRKSTRHPGIILVPSWYHPGIIHEVCGIHHVFTCNAACHCPPSDAKFICQGPTCRAEVHLAEINQLPRPGIPKFCRPYQSD